MLRGLARQKTNIGPLIKDGLYTSDNSEMAKIMSNQYASVYSTPTHPLLEAKDP